MFLFARVLLFYIEWILPFISSDSNIFTWQFFWLSTLFSFFSRVFNFSFRLVTLLHLYLSLVWSAAAVMLFLRGNFFFRFRTFTLVTVCCRFSSPLWADPSLSCCILPLLFIMILLWDSIFREAISSKLSLIYLLKTLPLLTFCFFFALLNDFIKKSVFKSAKLLVGHGLTGFLFLGVWRLPGLLKTGRDSFTCLSALTWYFSWLYLLIYS